MADTEVKTRLTLEDEASDELEDVADKVDDVEKAERKAEGGFKSFAETAAHTAQALGVNLRDVVGRVKDIGLEFVNVGADAESGDHAIAALLKVAQGKTSDAAIDQAEQLGDAIDEIAIRSGLAGDSVGAAFQAILEKTGASEGGVRQATEQLDKMAIVAGKLDKDIGGVANEFAFMQEGTLKVKGQLFQLLQSTGIFGNNTKKAAEAWGKLTEEKRAELLSAGLDKLAGTMGDMPVTFKQASAGLANMVRISKEMVGQPIIEELTPAIDELTDELMKLGPDIQEFARAMAKDVGAAVREGGKQLRDAVGWLKDHKDEIAAGFREGAERIKEVVNFILAHKEEIALAFGAKAAMPLVKAGAGVVGTVAKAGVAEGAGMGMGAAAGAAAGATVALAALAVAIVSVGVAADQASKLSAEYADTVDTHLTSMKKLMAAAESGEDLENVRNMVATMQQLDEAGGNLDDNMKRFYKSVLETAERAADLKIETNEHLMRQIAIAKQGIADTYNKSLGDTSQAGQQWAAQMTSNNLWILTNAYNQAAKNHDTAAMTLAAQTLASSGMVSEAFLKSTTDIEGGFGAMADTLIASGSQFADFANKLRGKGATATPKAPTINFNGGQTISIKQDFRDQDPDRVAIQTSRTFGRAALRQVQSKLTGPFGG